MARRIFTIYFIFLSLPLFSQSSDSTSTWTFHFMNTVVQQGHEGLNVPYSGIKSLDTDPETQITVRNTWFLGRRIGKNTSVYINPELAGGSGLSGVAGIAGFPNGEAFRVGSGNPKVYVARAFVRHQIALGNETVLAEDGVNQLTETLPVRRLTLTAGKFSLLDYFDGSTYANDGRTQFMNWALMTGGAYDFASDTRGNTWGVVAELITPKRTVRFAWATPSSTPNGPKFDLNLTKAHGLNFEFRENIKLFGRDATVGITTFYNSTLGMRFRDIVYTQPDSVAKHRTSYHDKYGLALNIEQQTNLLGWFVTGSWADGTTENWGFTQIDKSIMGGVVISGQKWKRPSDRLGLAGVMNGLSADQTDFLERGGNGFIIGDGKLRYAPEKAVELYYSIRVHQHIYITFDYQYFWNIAFNADRGNVGVWGIRSHVDI